jgi:hypothetical protein
VKVTGESFFQKLTNATPITSMPPVKSPSTRQASMVSADVTVTG